MDLRFLALVLQVTYEIAAFAEDTSDDGAVARRVRSPEDEWVKVAEVAMKVLQPSVVSSEVRGEEVLVTYSDGRFAVKGFEEIKEKVEPFLNIDLPEDPPTILVFDTPEKEEEGTTNLNFDTREQ